MRFSSQGPSAAGWERARPTCTVPAPMRTAGPPEPLLARWKESGTSTPRWNAPMRTRSSRATATQSSAGHRRGWSSAAREYLAIASALWSPARTTPRRRPIRRVYDGQSMGVHLEEGSFVVRISLSAEFGEDYEGDEDGYVWLE